MWLGPRPLTYVMNQKGIIDQVVQECKFVSPQAIGMDGFQSVVENVTMALSAFHSELFNNLNSLECLLNVSSFTLYNIQVMFVCDWGLSWLLSLCK